MRLCTVQPSNKQKIRSKTILLIINNQSHKVLNNQTYHAVNYINKIKTMTFELNIALKINSQKTPTNIRNKNSI